MQLRRYIPPARAAKASANAVTVEPGRVNASGQRVLRKAARSLQGMAGQNLYVLQCEQPGCGHQYCEEGIRVHARTCPRCQGGKPGLPVPEAEPTLFSL